MLFENLPMLPGADKRQPTQVNSADLNKVGVSSSAFSLHAGDRITIDTDESGNLIVAKQPLRNDDPNTFVYWIGCKRNGQPSWLALGSLTRRDYQGNYLDKTREKLGTYANFMQMYQGALKGKTIVCEDAQPFKFAKFDKNQRVEGEYNERMDCPIHLEEFSKTPSEV